MASLPSAITSSTVTDVRPTVNCLPIKQLGSLLELSIFEKSFFMLFDWKVLGDTIIEHSNTYYCRTVWDETIYKYCTYTLYLLKRSTTVPVVVAVALNAVFRCRNQTTVILVTTHATFPTAVDHHPSIDNNIVLCIRHKVINDSGSAGDSIKIFCSPNCIQSFFPTLAVGYSDIYILIFNIVR